MADADSFIQALHRPSSLLPIASHKDALLYTIENNAVTIVVGQTGSGKTTQLPQYLERAGYCNDNKVIAITQACITMNQHFTVYQVDESSQILTAQTSGSNDRREACSRGSAM
jgi:type II secretory ATPase GspE/PulE/Tfp pilus assembly ATPase PilB-like protein